jgi:hypothetical protein
MKKEIFCLLLGILLVITFSCTKEKIEILVPEDYSGWKRLTDVELDSFVPGHESHYRIPYINSIGEEVEITTDSEGKTSYNYKEGTIIVKEIYPTLQYREGDKPMMLTVMVKKPDHRNAQGGWVWIARDMETNQEMQFKSDMCVNCHAGANGQHPYEDKNPNEEFRDYVFYPWRK